MLKHAPESWRCPDRHRCTCAQCVTTVTPMQLMAGSQCQRAPLIPNGWPKAIAPPLGLTVGHHQAAPIRVVHPTPGPRSFVQFNHVHIVNTQPCAFQHRRVAGTGPSPIRRGSTPAVAWLRYAPAVSVLALLPSVHWHNQRSGSVIHPGSIACGNHPLARNGAFNPRNCSSVVSGRSAHHVVFLLQHLSCFSTQPEHLLSQNA